MILFVFIYLFLSWFSLLVITNFVYYYLCYSFAKKKFNDITNVQFSEIRKEILNNSSANYKIKSKQFWLYMANTAISIGLAFVLSELTIGTLEIETCNGFLEIILNVLFMVIYWLSASFIGFKITMLLVRN